jgi:hypothetical protein
MRILLIGALSAPLIGCACPPSPQATPKACTSKGCLHRTSAGAPTEVRSAAFKPNPVAGTDKPSFSATTNSSAKSDSSHDDKTGSSIAASRATRIDVSGQPSDVSDAVLQKAKSIVASKMEVPASAEFADMKRAMRTDVVGQSVDTICGHVKGKTAAGETTGERAFLYLVKDNVAFVDYGNPGVAADAYRNICASPDR